MDRQKDIACIKEILNGNSSAFAFLVDKYKDRVFTLALKITGNREDAEEVAQDVFLNAYRGLAEFKNSAGFSTWIYRITYNQAVSKTRKKKITTEPIDQKLNGIETYGEYDAKLSETLDDIPSCHIEKAMNCLDETEYNLMFLYYREELSVKEIASVTGLNVSNVKVKLFRSRKKLLEKLTTVLKTRITDLI